MIIFLQKIFQKNIYIFFLLFFCVIPFHAFGITIITHFFLGEYSPAPIFLKMWKEIFLVFLFGIIFFSQNFSKKIWRKFFKNLDSLDIFILIFTIFSLFLSFKNFSENSFSTLFYGIKYTLFPFWIFFIFRRIPENIAQKFLSLFWKIFPYFLGILLFLGFLFFIISQYSPKFFIFLGYSHETSFHSIFQPLSYCQKISNTEICRAQGVFSGPNQFGAYLIFLISLFFPFLFSKKILFWGIFIIGIITLFTTFSRSAWIGMIFSGIFFLFFLPDISKRKKQKIFILILFFPLFFLSIGLKILPEFSDKIFKRVSSSSQHYELSQQGISHIQENFLGSGLGTAGAASKYSSEEGKKETGFIPENWYLQIGIETGVFGIFLWLGIIFLTIKFLLKENLMLATAIFGISIMGIFLHSWESSSVAYTVWGIAGILLRKKYLNKI